MPDRNRPAFDEKIADLRILLIAAQTGEHDAYKEFPTRVSRHLHRRYEGHLPAPVLGRAVCNTSLTIHALRHIHDPVSSFESWISEIAGRRVRDSCRPRGQSRLLARMKLIQRHASHETTDLPETSAEGDELLSKACGSMRPMRIQALAFIGLSLRPFSSTTLAFSPADGAILPI